MNLNPKEANLEAIKLVQLLMQNGHYERYVGGEAAIADIARDISTLAKVLVDPAYK